MTRRATFAVIFASVVIVALPAVGAKRPKDADVEQVDNLALAAMLVKDGHVDRARAVLSEIDPKAEDLDLVQYHTLCGVVALKREDHRSAEEHLLAAIAAGQKEPSAFILLAQARFGLQNYPGTLKALDRAGSAAHSWPGSYLLRAQCHWRQGDKEGAWSALRAGIKAHPEARELHHQLLMLLIDLGLYRQATTEGLRYLAHEDAGPNAFVALAEGLRRGQEHRRAIVILEQAHLRFPADKRILAQLAHSYIDADLPLSAAGLLRQAAELDPKYLPEAAELYRRGGSLLQALYLNAEVRDQKKKIRQRLGLLIELQRFEQATALAPRLARLGLLDDQRIVYALAYGYYKNGQFDRAENWLKRISDSKLFAKAIELRKAMDACKQLGWSCD